MVNKKLPKTKELWAGIPRPALAKKVLRMSRKGVYMFRVTEGLDVYGNSLFKVETRNIFGLLDDFCTLFTDDFKTKEEAFSFYDTCQKEAKKEYERLQQKQSERMAKHDG